VAAEAAWSGDRRQAIRALATYPWMGSLHIAESVYDAMAEALEAYLPERLLRRGPVSNLRRGRWVLGVDAGNTKTVALVADGSGRIAGWGRAGPGDIYGTSPSDAVEEVNAAVSSALAMARVERRGVAAVALSMAGVDWPEDEAFWRRCAQGRPISERRYRSEGNRTRRQILQVEEDLSAV